MAIVGRILRWIFLRGRSTKRELETRTVSAEPVRVTETPREDPEMVERRTFLKKVVGVAVGIGAFVAGVPVIGLLVSPTLRREDEVWQVVGAVDEFGIGRTVGVTYVDPEPLPWAGFTAQSAAYIRRESADTFIAFSVYCTHTGCPVNWVADAGLFLCPCHGGVFHRDGAVAAGPVRRPLDRIPVRVQAGQVEILRAPVPVTHLSRRESLAARNAGANQRARRHG
jgi:menaquinol-cytochrome c reductase iron-sulfur subunit